MNKSKLERTKKVILDKAHRQCRKFPHLFKEYDGELTIQEAIAVILTLDMILEVDKRDMFDLLDNINEL